MSFEQSPPPEDTKRGYKPDPLGADNLRWWDGTKWGPQTRPVTKRGPKKKRKMPTWLIVVLSVLGVIIIAAALAGDEESGTDEPAPEPTPAVEEQTTGFNKQLQDAVLESVEEKEYPTFWCRGDECRVYYRRGETLGVLISSQEEILEEQRRIWRTMFSRPQTKEATILVEGPVTTVGGKSKVAPILDVTCTRAAANQINWNVVDVDGMRALCDWRELVDF